MPIRHTKPFGVYHWDTFDNETFLKGQFDSQEAAVDFIMVRYRGRIRSTGADRVDIVDSYGTIVQQFQVG